MNGEQTPVIDGTSQESEVQAAPAPELSSPHFDDIAVAVAQPVKPLPWYKRINLFVGTRESIAIVMAFGAIFLIVAFAASFLVDASEQTVSRTEATMADESKPIHSPQSQAMPATAPQVEATVNSAAIITQKYARGFQRKPSRTHAWNRPMRFVDEDGKPVARKVGEIHYGRASDRP
jgi:hypothetical protein